jgi:hypothetical protein
VRLTLLFSRDFFGGDEPTIGTAKVHPPSAFSKELYIPVQLTNEAAYFDTDSDFYDIPPAYYQDLPRLPLISTSEIHKENMAQLLQLGSTTKFVLADETPVFTVRHFRYVRER